MEKEMFMSPERASKLLGVSEERVKEMIENKEIKANKLNGIFWIIPVSEIKKD